MCRFWLRRASLRRWLGGGRCYFWKGGWNGRETHCGCAMSPYFVDVVVGMNVVVGLGYTPVKCIACSVDVCEMDVGDLFCAVRVRFVPL